MYSQSIPLVEMELGRPVRDLDARFDPRIGRPMKPSVRSSRPSGLKDDHIASDRPSIGRRTLRTLTRFFIAVLGCAVIASASSAASCRTTFAFALMARMAGGNRSGGGAAARPALPLLRRTHVRHRDFRGRLPTTPPADGKEDRWLMSKTALR